MMPTDRALLHFPVLSRADFLFFRLLGPGLGNLLFPMYRAFQAQREEGGQLVFPQFFQWKPGPWLRREKDARAYSDLFRRRTPHEMFLHAKAVSLRLSGHTQRLRVQEGLGRHFHDLDPAHQAAFKQWLVGHYRQRDALHSMLRMSVHGSVITSRSSFSLWAAYMGSGQAIVHRDFALAGYLPDHAIRVISC